MPIRKDPGPSGNDSSVSANSRRHAPAVGNCTRRRRCDQALYEKLCTAGNSKETVGPGRRRGSGDVPPKGVAERRKIARLRRLPHGRPALDGQ